MPLFVEPDVKKYFLDEGDDLGPVSCNSSSICNGTSSTNWITPNGKIVDSTLYIQNITTGDFGDYTCAFTNASAECMTLTITVTKPDDTREYKLNYIQANLIHVFWKFIKEWKLIF